MQPLISVIIPVYNVETYLEQCVESVVNQSYKNIEIILIDDGSLDNSRVICDKFAIEDSRVKVIHKKNGGSSEARNIGIDLATGDYTIFLDSDDYWNDNQCLQEIVNKIKVNPNVDIILFNMSKLYNETGIIEKPLKTFDIKQLGRLNHSESIEYLVKNDLYISSACNKVVKRKIIVDNHLYFKIGFVGEDIEWSAKLMLHLKKIDAINNPFYIYRKQREHSISNVKDVSYRKVDNVLTIVEERLLNINKVNIDETLYHAYMSFIAYQYSTIIGLLGTMTGEKKELVRRMKKISYILKYDTNYKVKKVRILYSIMGFTFTSLILGKYITFKY